MYPQIYSKFSYFSKFYVAVCSIKMLFTANQYKKKIYKSSAELSHKEHGRTDIVTKNNKCYNAPRKREMKMTYVISTYISYIHAFHICQIFLKANVASDEGKGRNEM